MWCWGLISSTRRIASTPRSSRVRPPRIGCAAAILDRTVTRSVASCRRPRSSRCFIKSGRVRGRRTIGRRGAVLLKSSRSSSGASRGIAPDSISLIFQTRQGRSRGIQVTYKETAPDLTHHCELWRHCRQLTSLCNRTHSRRIHAHGESLRRHGHVPIAHTRLTHTAHTHGSHA